MLIVRKRRGRLKFLASKEAYPIIVRQLEEITTKKAKAKNARNARKTNLGSIGTPLRYLSVKKSCYIVLKDTLILGSSTSAVESGDIPISKCIVFIFCLKIREKQNP